VLDVALCGDDCLLWVGCAGGDFAGMRHVAVNLLKSVDVIKVGTRNRPLCAT
jgi:hypothetical protein